MLGIWITAAPAVILFYHTKKDEKSFEYRHKKISYVIISLLLFFTTVLLYGSFIEPHLIRISHYDIELPKIVKPIRIAFVSDFQIGTYNHNDWVETVVKKIKEQQPDIVFLGGDNVDNILYNETEAQELKPLQKLAQEYPVYAINGNHEYGVGRDPKNSPDTYQGADMSIYAQHILENMGIHYLVNDLEKVTVNKQSFYLFGGGSYWAGKLDFSVLENRNEQIPTLALIHNPSFIFEQYPTDVNLYLSGHTHGGQIRLPFIGPIGRVDNILPKDYYKGLHTLSSKTKLLVTVGIGESGTRARLWNPPEIALITLR